MSDPTATKVQWKSGMTPRIHDGLTKPTVEYHNERYDYKRQGVYVVESTNALDEFPEVGLLLEGDARMNAKQAIVFQYINDTLDFLAMDPPVKDTSAPKMTYHEFKHMVLKTYTGLAACVSLGIDVIHVERWGSGPDYANDLQASYYILLLSAWIAGIREVHFWKTSNLITIPRLATAIYMSTTLTTYLAYSPTFIGYESSAVRIMYDMN